MSSISALEIGSTVTSLLGLLGLAVACTYLILLARIKSAERTLSLLPPGDRIGFADTLLTRYGVNAKGLSPEDKYDLLTREMTLRYRKELLLAVLGAASFVGCVAMVLINPPGVPNANGRVRTEADNVVLGYKKDILAVRGDYEARDRNPGSLKHVKSESLRLAQAIGAIHDADLNPSRIVIRDEYGGWALLLAARAEEDDDLRLRYAKDAVNSFSKAVATMEEIRDAHARGDRFAAEDYDWMMGESADWDRTRYLKAASLALLARAGDRDAQVEARQLLDNVSASFKSEFPPQNMEEFYWLLSN